MGFREKVPLIVALIALVLALVQFLLMVYLLEMLKALITIQTVPNPLPTPRLRFWFD